MAFSRLPQRGTEWLRPATLAIPKPKSLEYKLAAEEPESPPAANLASERPLGAHCDQINGTPEGVDSLFG